MIDTTLDSAFAGKGWKASFGVGACGVSCTFHTFVLPNIMMGLGMALEILGSWRDHSGRSWFSRGSLAIHKRKLWTPRIASGYLLLGALKLCAITHSQRTNMISIPKMPVSLTPSHNSNCTQKRRP